MKIRNKYDGSVIESSSLKDVGYFYRLTNLGNCNIMFKHDGWKEVKELSEEEKLNHLHQILLEWIGNEDLVGMIIDEYKNII